MIQIADLSSEMKLDQMEAGYSIKTAIYEKERTILIFTVIIALLTLVAGGMFYYNIRQKGVLFFIPDIATSGITFLWSLKLVWRFIALTDLTTLQ